MVLEFVHLVPSLSMTCLSLSLVQFFSVETLHGHLSVQYLHPRLYMGKLMPLPLLGLAHLVFCFSLSLLHIIVCFFCVAFCRKCGISVFCAQICTCLFILLVFPCVHFFMGFRQQFQQHEVYPCGKSVTPAVEVFGGLDRSLIFFLQLRVQG